MDFRVQFADIHGNLREGYSHIFLQILFDGVFGKKEAGSLPTLQEDDHKKVLYFRAVWRENLSLWFPVRSNTNQLFSHRR